jgi:hypothetical protein
MLQVFSEAYCKRLFKMLHLFSNVCCNRFLSGCCICCNNMFPNVLVLSVLCYSKWFDVASCKCFILNVSHTCCKSIFPNVSSIFSLMSHSCCKFLCCSTAVEPGASGRGHEGPANVGVAVGARWGHARPHLLIASPRCRPRGDRGEGQERPAGGETGTECARGVGRRRTGSGLQWACD